MHRKCGQTDNRDGVLCQLICVTDTLLAHECVEADCPFLLTHLFKAHLYVQINSNEHFP